MAAGREPRGRAPGAGDRGILGWLLGAVILFSHPSHQQRQIASVTPQDAAVASVHHAITWQRSRTWHWQTVAGVKHSPTIRGAGRYHSVGYMHWIERRWNRRRLAAYKLAHRPRSTYRTPATYSATGSVPALICQVFGSACGEAKAVAWCESRFSTTAVNGQYLGIFQLGSYERARYATIGYSTAYQQIVAAHNYYMVAGWGPWSCA